MANDKPGVFVIMEGYNNPDTMAKSPEELKALLQAEIAFYKQKEREMVAITNMKKLLVVSTAAAVIWTCIAVIVALTL